jgi:hypothetical protein
LDVPSHQLTALYLYNNELKGSIPSEIAMLTQLTQLYLFNSQLTGNLPSSLCDVGVTIRIDCGEIACTCCASGVDENANALLDDSCPSAWVMSYDHS